MTSKTGLCKDFKGDRPCKNYWIDRNHNCFDPDSPLYSEYSHRILLIKLDALGDVVRCTPLTEGIKKKYPDSQFTWLVKEESRIFLQNNNYIDKIVSYNDENVRILQCQKFDIVINLDKDGKATSLMNSMMSENKFGYGMSEYGFPIPLNKETEYHYEICLDNWGSKRKNTKTYIEMMFDISRLKYSGEKPKVILDISKKEKFKNIFLKENNIKSKDKIIILNTGCGPVYPHKKWTYSGYRNLIKLLSKNKNIKVILVGSSDDVDRNIKLYDECWFPNLNNTTNKYTLEEFCFLINLSDVVVTGDTMALHLGISLNKKIITFFGPTPYQETDLFGLGKKFVRNELDCLGCHDQFECPYEGKCMSLIEADKVYEKIKKII